MTLKTTACELQAVTPELDTREKINSYNALGIFDETIEAYQLELLKYTAFEFRIPRWCGDLTNTTNYDHPTHKLDIAEACGKIVACENFTSTTATMTNMADVEHLGLSLQQNGSLVCCDYKNYKIDHYDTKTRKCTKTIKWYPPHDHIKCVAFDGNGALATVTCRTVLAYREVYTKESVIQREAEHAKEQTKAINLWDTNTGKLIKMFLTPYPVSKLAFGENVLIACDCKDKSAIVIFNVSTGHRISTILAPESEMVVSLKDGLIASAGTKHGVSIWDIKTRRCVDTLCAEEEDDATCAFDGKDLLAIATRKHLFVWQLSTKKMLVTVNVPLREDRIHSIVFGGSGLIATNHNGGGVRLWDVSTGVCVNRLKIGWVRGTPMDTDSPNMIVDETEMLLLASDGILAWRH